MYDSARSKLIEDLKNGDSSAREQAAFELGKLRELSTVPALTEALLDEKLFVGKRAAEALDKMGVSALLETAKKLRDENSSVRRRAVELLGELDDANAVPILLTALFDSNSYVQTDAMLSLGKIGDASAVPSLLYALKDKKNYVRQGAAVALEKIGTAKTLPLKVLACRKLSPQQRVDALTELAEVLYGDVYGKLRYNIASVRYFCVNALSSDDEEVRVGAQTVLNWMNGDQYLLQSSYRNASKDGRELLRPAESGSDSEPETLLIASEKPGESPRKLPFWKRLFVK